MKILKINKKNLLTIECLHNKKTKTADGELSKLNLIKSPCTKSSSKLIIETCPGLQGVGSLYHISSGNSISSNQTQELDGKFTPSKHHPLSFNQKAQHVFLAPNFRSGRFAPIIKRAFIYFVSPSVIGRHVSRAHYTTCLFYFPNC